MRNWNPHWSPRNNISSRFQTTYEELKHPVLFRKRRGAGFQTTYEELKLLVAVGGFGDGASRLPMRNWNKPGKPSPQAGCCCFQTTYEELKRAWMILSSLQASCFQTTYEELKHISNSGPYQRNGFQTTYEELKRSIKTTRPPNPAGFQTTYEELKPSLFSTTLRKRAGFQTTYEELKQVFLCSFRFSGCHASRLPMRNWNLLSFPRRCASERFQTTYEELKLSSPTNTVAREDVKLPDYLWGIETIHISGNQSRNSASRLPMRNWNRQTIWKPRSKSWRFQTTYEELKHISNSGPYQRNGFQTTYEELKQKFGICRQF